MAGAASGFAEQAGQPAGMGRLRALSAVLSTRRKWLSKGSLALAEVGTPPGRLLTHVFWMFCVVVWCANNFIAVRVSGDIFGAHRWM